MPPSRIELSWEDVSQVAEKIEEVAPPVNREKIAQAFGIVASTLTKVAHREGWADKLNELTRPNKIRSVDEALKAVAELVKA